jgi:hypothetical protein
MQDNNIEHPALVTVETRPPHAIYHDGEQRTGTVHGVPYHQAMRMLTAKRWVQAVYWPVP